MPSLEDWVGRYALVVSKELEEFIERTFVDTAGASDADRVRREALEEARRAELEISPEGWVASRSGGVEFYRVEVAPEAFRAASVRFEKAPGVAVELTLLDATRLSARQDGKPLLQFVRQSRPS